VNVAPSSTQESVDEQITRLLKSATNKKGQKVLCLDGGGIRGLLLILSLIKIEELTKKNIGQLFDWVKVHLT
jgi:hypothetical protein